MNSSRKLIEGVDSDGNRALFVVDGGVEQGYELFRAHLVHVSHHRRSGQAVAHAHGENPKEPTP